MRKVVLLALMLVTLIFGVAGASTSYGTLTLRVLNHSSKDIQRVHLGWSGTGRWGPDRLGKELLKAGGSISLTDIPPGDYDLLFVDNKENQCVFRNLPIYNNRSWVITNEWLSRCPH